MKRIAIVSQPRIGPWVHKQLRKHKGRVKARNLSTHPYFSSKVKVGCEDFDECYILTSSKGLVKPDDTVTEKDVAEFARNDFEDPETQEKLVRIIRKQAQELGLFDADEIVFLGSASERKYVRILKPIFGDKVTFPLKGMFKSMTVENIRKALKRRRYERK